MEHFRVEVEELPGDVRSFKVAGELDQATADQLRQPLLETIGAGDGTILIDLTDCAFMDSTGLAVLVEARRQASEANGLRLGVCCPGVQVRRLLEVTGLDRAVGVHETRDEALAALAA